MFTGFNLLQLHRLPLSQMKGRCVLLVLGEGRSYTCPRLPQNLAMGCGTERGSLNLTPQPIHMTMLGPWVVKGRCTMTSENKQVAIFLSKTQRWPFNVQCRSNQPSAHNRVQRLTRDQNPLALIHHLPADHPHCMLKNHVCSSTKQ